MQAKTARGEEPISQVLAEILFGPHGVADQLGKTVGQVADAKRRIDRNIQFLLSVLNLPSRADYNNLVEKVEGLQGSLVNLNIKLDRLMAAQQDQARVKPRAAKPRRASVPDRA